MGSIISVAFWLECQLSDAYFNFLVLFISSTAEYRGTHGPHGRDMNIIFAGWCILTVLYNFSDIASASQTKTLYANYSHQLHHDFCPAVLHQLSTYDVTPASMATGSEVLLENKNSSCS